MTTSRRILICDDDDAVRSSLGFLLSKAGYLPNFASKPDDIIRHVGETTFDLILLDMNFSMSISGEEGIALLKHIISLKPDVPVVLITAWGSVELAVRGMKLGASDFVTKPWNNVQLLKIIETSIALSGKRDAHTRVSAVRTRSQDFPGIIGEDHKLLEVLEVIKRVSPTHAPVLITGESGTGKELIASAIHRFSGRKDNPFVKVNLGGIPASLFESEMFGYKKGAFTDAKSDHRGRFERANRGTIFLDEIGDLHLASQVKLLRVLQDQTFERLGDQHSLTVDVRAISATNRDLYSLACAGSFREDLLYRINLIHIEVPPLRQRVGDIPLLAGYFIDQATTTYSIATKTLTGEATEWLCSQSWPGNVRELRNIIERTLLLAKSDVIRSSDFITALPAGKMADMQQTAAAGTLDEMEKHLILETLREFGGNFSKSAEKLGISRATLYRKLEKHGIQISRNE
jgi:two-component system, NtrC family, response regulator